MKTILQFIAFIAFFAILNYFAHEGYVKESFIALFVVIGAIGTWTDTISVPRYIIFIIFCLSYNEQYGWNLKPANDTERILDAVALILFSLSITRKKTS